LPHHELEVVFLAQEVGEIGRQGIDDEGKLVLIGLGAEPGTVIRQVVGPVMPHALAQARLDKLLLVLMQLDAAPLIHQADDVLVRLGFSRAGIHAAQSPQATRAGFPSNAAHASSNEPANCQFLVSS
jgi:hypothetical protein